MFFEGAVIVSTPQDVALADAQKGVAMFRKVNVPILGLVQNMSFYTCPKCNHKDRLFGHEAGIAKLSDAMGLDIIGEIPLNPQICTLSDTGKPISFAEPLALESQIYSNIAKAIMDKTK